MIVFGVTVTWWEAALGFTMALAYSVPLFAGVGALRSFMLGFGWQLFLLTLVSILTERHS